MRYYVRLVQGKGLVSHAKFFWRHVFKTHSCWFWIGAQYPSGYGMFRFPGESPNGAHVAAWRFTRGEIPKRMLVCHTCDTKQCVNPKHLFLGTYKTNNEDSARKGSNPGFRKCFTIRCMRGHLLRGGNLYVHALSGKRGCKICRDRARIRFVERKRNERQAESNRQLSVQS